MPQYSDFLHGLLPYCLVSPPSLHVICVTCRLNALMIFAHLRTEIIAGIPRLFSDCTVDSQYHIKTSFTARFERLWFRRLFHQLSFRISVRFMISSAPVGFANLGLGSSLLLEQVKSSLLPFPTITILSPFNLSPSGFYFRHRFS